MKKLISLILCITFVLSMLPFAASAYTQLTDAEKQAHANTTFSVSKTNYTVGETITFNYTNCVSNDWVAIYNDSISEGYGLWAYVTGNGSISLPGGNWTKYKYNVDNMTPGSYTANLFCSDTQKLVATVKFTVTSTVKPGLMEMTDDEKKAHANTTFTATKEQYTVGETITFNYSNCISQDWVGIYNDDISGSYGVWSYVTGTGSISIPGGSWSAYKYDVDNMTPGSYTAVLFCSDTSKYVAHASFTVTVPAEKVYYLDGVNGSDTASGETADTAFATLAHAISVIGNENATVRVIGTYTVANADNAAHTGTLTIEGGDSSGKLIPTEGIGIDFGGPTVFRNISYSREYGNSYMCINGGKTVFGSGFKPTSANDWIAFGKSYSGNPASPIDVVVEDGSFTGEFNLGGVMPAADYKVSGDAKIKMTGGTIANLSFGSSNYDKCQGTTFTGSILVMQDGGTISKLTAHTSGNGSPTVVEGAVMAIFNNGIATVPDKSFDAITCDNKYYVYSTPDVYTEPVFDTNGKLVPGKVIVTIEDGKGKVAVQNGDTTDEVNSGETVTLTPGTTNIGCAESTVNKMTWKPMDKGYISFVFDDNRSSLPDFYRIITEEYDMPICAAVPSKTLATNNGVLHKIQDHGGEILSHTRDHITLNFTRSWTDIDYQLSQSKKELTADGFNINGIILAGGTGENKTPEFRAAIEPYTAQYYQYSDWYGVSTQYYKPRNWFDGRSVQELKNIIQKNIDNKTWEVIYAHDFNECSEETLYAVLDFCKEKTEAGELEIITYRDIHKRFANWEKPVDLGDTTYQVDFYSNDKKTFLSSYVAVKGTAAKAPTNLDIRSGYSIKGWSGDFSNVTGNMKVYAICADSTGTIVPDGTENLITVQRTYYVDAVNGSDTNDGYSVSSPLATLTKAASLAGDSDFTVIIIGEIKDFTGFPSHNGVMTVRGYDANSKISIKNNANAPTSGRIIIENIEIYNGQYAYISFGGKKTVIGEGFVGSGATAHQFITGGYNVSTLSGIDFEMNSGTCGRLALGNMACSSTSTIQGDVKLVVNGGKVTAGVILANEGWMTSHCGTTYAKNVLIEINGGNVASVKGGLNQYLSNINGALEVIFNNGITAAIDTATIDAMTISGGKYYVYSDVGGNVDFCYDDKGNSIAGKFHIELPEGYAAKIDNAGERINVSSSSDITLNPGQTHISYVQVDSDSAICVDNGSEKKYYVQADTVKIDFGGKITFPQPEELPGKLFAGWYSDEAFTKPVVNGSTVSAGTTLYVRYLDCAESDFGFEGSQIRIEGELGLRFVSKITNALAETLASLNAENNDFCMNGTTGYGTVVIPETFCGSSELTVGGTYTLNGREYAAKTVFAKKIFKKDSTFTYYTVAITNIGDDIVNRYYRICPVILYTDASGLKHTVYGKPYSTSLYAVAQRIYNDGAADEPEANRKAVLDYLSENILSVGVDKVIALSIDDGPQTTSSLQILDVLNKYGCHATYFQIGVNVNATTTPIIKKIVEAGCEIGNHSYGYSSMTGYSTADEILDNYNKAQNAFFGATGKYPVLFRAPGLGVSDLMFDTIPVPIISGYTSCADWDTMVGLQPRVNAMLSDAADGRIILIHDVPNNIEALEIVLPQLMEKGFKVVTVSELMEMRGYVPVQYQHIQLKEISK